MKTCLKWLGGKAQLLDEILNIFPKTISNYRELFLGGGTVLLGLLSHIKAGKIIVTGKIYAYDKNAVLIDVYKNIQNHPDVLYEYIQYYMNQYRECGDDTNINRNAETLEEAKLSRENYYYWLRKDYNSMDKQSDNIRSSALFMVLNKTCFRGVYREGPNGFNVPYGHYKALPTVITYEQLTEMSKLISDVIFSCSDYKESFQGIQSGDFVYLDPPYAPENKNSFVGYTRDGFSLEEHDKLFEYTVNLDKQGIKFVMNNADVDIVNNKFKDFTIKKILCRRAIHSKKPDTKTMEVIISN